MRRVCGKPSPAFAFCFPSRMGFSIGCPFPRPLVRSMRPGFSPFAPIFLHPLLGASGRVVRSLMMPPAPGDRRRAPFLGSPPPLLEASPPFRPALFCLLGEPIARPAFGPGGIFRFFRDCAGSFLWHRERSVPRGNHVKASTRAIPFLRMRLFTPFLSPVVVVIRFFKTQHSFILDRRLFSTNMPFVSTSSLFGPPAPFHSDLARPSLSAA